MVVKRYSDEEEKKRIEELQAELDLGGQPEPPTEDIGIPLTDTGTKQIIETALDKLPEEEPTEESKIKAVEEGEKTVKPKEEVLEEKTIDDAIEEPPKEPAAIPEVVEKPAPIEEKVEVEDNLIELRKQLVGADQKSANALRDRIIDRQEILKRRKDGILAEIEATEKENELIGTGPKVINAVKANNEHIAEYKAKLKLIEDEQKLPGALVEANKKYVGTKSTAPTVEEEEEVIEDIPAPPPGTVREGGTILEAAPKVWTDGRMILAEDGYGRPLALTDANGVTENLVYKGEPDTDEDGKLVLSRDQENRPVHVRPPGGNIETVVYSTKPKSELQQIQDEIDIEKKKVVDEQVAQNTALAEIKDEYGVEAEKAYNNYIEREKQINQSINKAEADTTDIIDTLLNTKVDPNAYWDSKSFWQKDAMLAAILVGSLSTNPNHTNVVVEQINKNIDRDINSQKANIANLKSAAGLQNNLVGRLYQKLGNLGVASQTATLLLKNNFLQKLQSEQLKTNNPVLKAQLQVQIGETKKAMEQARITTIQKSIKDAAKLISDRRTAQEGREQDLSKAYASRLAKTRVGDLKFGFDNIVSGFIQNDGAGDVAIIQGIARMNDPGSVVREAEFKNWSNFVGTLSIDQLKRLWRGATLGRRLTDSEREKLITLSKRILKNKGGELRALNKEFINKVGIANRQYGYAINPAQVASRDASLKNRELDLISNVKKTLFANNPNIGNTEVIEYIKQDPKLKVFLGF